MHLLAQHSQASPENQQEPRQNNEYAAAAAAGPGTVGAARPQIIASEKSPAAEITEAHRTFSPKNKEQPQTTGFVYRPAAGSMRPSSNARLAAFAFGTHSFIFWIR
jgi:hypothetical protein